MRQGGLLKSKFPSGGPEPKKTHAQYLLPDCKAPSLYFTIKAHPQAD